MFTEVRKVRQVAAAISAGLLASALMHILFGANEEPPDSSTTAKALPTSQWLSTASEDRYPNRTARDWVTFADYSAVVTVVRELPGEASPDQIALGEGMIQRSVLFTIDEVLWRRDGADSLPDAIVFPALGWFFKGSPEDRVRAVRQDAPRFEMGHTYILALYSDSCVSGATPWRGLGADSAIPYDGAIGIGELSGNIIEEQLANPDRLDPNYSFEDEAAGQDSSYIKDELKQAVPLPNRAREQSC